MYIINKDENNVIKSIDIQVSDIKKMFYSDSEFLLQLYVTFLKNKECESLNDEIFIRIHRNKIFNRRLVDYIINTSWILNIDELDKLPIEELKIILDEINLNCPDGKDKELYSYEYNTLEEYINQRENNIVLNRIRRRIPNFY